MTPTPLHQLAEDGRNNLTRRASEASAPSQEIQEIIDSVQRLARVSVNMKPSALDSFLRTGRRLNVFEWAAAESRGTGQPVDALLRQKLKDWHHPRLRFEDRAGNGSHFHYGALNIGGMGSPRYGHYCVVDRRRPGETKPDPIWVAEDTLRSARFNDSVAGLLWERLADWVAPWDMAGELAAVKVCESANGRLLATRVCNNEEYIEALSLTSIVPSMVEEIRSESDERLQERALQAVLSGAKLSEELDLELHLRIRDKAEELEIPWQPWQEALK